MFISTQDNTLKSNLFPRLSGDKLNTDMEEIMVNSWKTPK
jgi:hypothetical protein